MKIRPFHRAGQAVGLGRDGARTAAWLIGAALLIPQLLIWTVRNVPRWSRPIRWFIRRSWWRAKDAGTWIELWGPPTVLLFSLAMWLSPSFRSWVMRLAAGPGLAMVSAMGLITYFLSRGFRVALRTNLQVTYDRRYKNRWPKYCDKYGVFEVTQRGHRKYPQVWVECEQLPEWKEILRGLLQFDGKSAKPPVVKLGVTPIGPKTMGPVIAGHNIEGLRTHFKFTQIKTPVMTKGDWVYICVNRQPTQHLKVIEDVA